ncbi:MAG: isocitrate/isopropylmalate family dehydrogenase, partial [Nitrospirota bacterium]
MYTITLIPGDGVGPEIAEATRRVIEATGISVKWEVHDAGEDVYQKEGNPLPDRIIDSIRKNKIAIKGPVTTPV